MQQFDIIVIGSGPAGQRAQTGGFSRRAAQRPQHYQ
jgi:succinate dehydrogenase/fumarate reductase flavoprotein subunit